MRDLKSLHDRAIDGAAAAKAAVEQNAFVLRQRISERTRLLSELEQTKLQERMNEALGSMSDLAPQADVPSFERVRDKSSAGIPRRWGSPRSGPRRSRCDDQRRARHLGRGGRARPRRPPVEHARSRKHATGRGLGRSGSGMRGQRQVFNRVGHVLRIERLRQRSLARWARSWPLRCRRPPRIGRVVVLVRGSVDDAHDPSSRGPHPRFDLGDGGGVHLHGRLAVSVPGHVRRRRGVRIRHHFNLGMGETTPFVREPRHPLLKEPAFEHQMARAPGRADAEIDGRLVTGPKVRRELRTASSPTTSLSSRQRAHWTAPSPRCGHMPGLRLITRRRSSAWSPATNLVEGGETSSSSSANHASGIGSFGAGPRFAVGIWNSASPSGVRSRTNSCTYRRANTGCMCWST